MDFNLSKSLEILQRTPDTLFAILQGISSDWTHNNEGGDTWSVYDIIGHLIHGEKTDWIPRIEIMLSDNKDKTFESFDRFAQFEESKDKTLAALLAEFKSLREKNIKSLQSFHLTKNDFTKKGNHPALGEVTLITTHSYLDRARPEPPGTNIQSDGKAIQNGNWSVERVSDHTARIDHT